MSLTYNRYLEEHIGNVAKAYWWLKTNLPEVTDDVTDEEEWIILKCHDESKYTCEEYDAYDEYFYGKHRTVEVEEAFNYAWLHHIHSNPHHWQYWVLINDEAEEGIEILDMPYHDIIHMICDWWSFSWKTGNLYEIFDWYEKHKHMKLSDRTRMKVETILLGIKDKLDELESDGEEGVDD